MIYYLEIQNMQNHCLNNQNNDRTLSIGDSGSFRIKITVA